MFPQEVDVINIALVLPVFSPAVVKATSVWVLCVFGNGKAGIGGWAIVCICAYAAVHASMCVHMCVHMCVCGHENYRGGVQCIALVS